MLDFNEERHEYSVDGRVVPHVTGIMRVALGNPFEHIAAGVLEVARQRGVAVHRACELDDAGELDEASVDIRISPYLEAWRDFRRDYRFEVIFAEQSLYSEAHGFAGRPDLAIQLRGGEVCVVDRKTGLPGRLAGLQTAAYAMLIDASNAFDMRRFALQMSAGGRYRLHEYTEPSDFGYFLSCLNVARLKERLAA